MSLVRKGYAFAISTITKYEIYAGATPQQLNFWDNILQTVNVLPLDETSVDIAVTINSALKRKRKQIDMADLFIAATAIAHKLSIATLNKNHFERIDKLALID